MTEIVQEWRALALKFDSHRMQALWHLQSLLADPEGHAEVARKFLTASVSEPFTYPLMLRGIAKFSGDGWKDTTKKGDVVFAWNHELPAPYKAGQFPRLGNPIWAASSEQYDFQPLTAVETMQVVEAHIEGFRASVSNLKLTFGINPSPLSGPPALNRLQSYLQQADERKGSSREVLHVINPGAENEAELRASDIRWCMFRASAPQAVQWADLIQKAHDVDGHCDIVLAADLEARYG